jgi:ribonuclease D
MRQRSLSKKSSRLPPPNVITSSSQLMALLQVLHDEPFAAVDTESNSLYAYQEQVCLIQISIPSADYVVDPLAGLDLSPLADLFANLKVQKIFHAAE